MQSIVLNSKLIAQKKVKSFKKKTLKRHETSILLAAGSGLFFILLGFFLVVIHAVFERHDPVLNYVGVASLVIAFVCFLLSAHLMDKSETGRRQNKRAEIQEIQQRDFIF